MKQRFEAVSRPYRLLIILGLLFISTIATSYLIYADQQQKIEGLQGTQTLKKQDTKQKIRTLLESIDPEILLRIDAGKKEILKTISTPDIAKLSNLSERVDFDKYLSFEPVDLSTDLSDTEDPNVVIDSGNLMWVNNGCYLYPKDALIK